MTMDGGRAVALFGGEVQYYRLAPRHWRVVLEQLRDAGIRTVTSYVPWEVHAVTAPRAGRPAGELDFEGRTDARLNLMGFLELVGKMGLRMNFRAGPFCCAEMASGGYPEWLICGDPGMMVWDWTNRPTQGYWIARRRGMQPSYLHPEYLRLCEAWIEAVAPIVKPRLGSAGGFIDLINLDNEVSYIVKDGLLDSDYNPVNVRAGGFYYQFLKEKYGTVGKLSEAYQRKVGSFAEVAPPREVPEKADGSFAWHADWMHFKTWCMAKYIQTLRGFYEARGVSDVTFMTNLNPHRPEGVPTRMPDFQEAVGAKGLVGYDFYRGCFMSYSGYHSMARVLKLMRASLPFTYSAEFMSGTWNLNLAKASRVSDDHMRFMGRCALAQGCKALSWFMFHDRDTWGDSPVSAHGHRRPSFEVLKETMALVREKLPTWEGLEPVEDVAVVYDLATHVHTSIGDPSPCADNDLHIGRPTVADVQAGLASREYEGLFRLVEQAGAQAGAVDTVHDARLLDGYRVAFLPGSPVVARATAEALTAWVEKGGHLVVSGAWPVVDERGAALSFLGGVPKGNSVTVGRGTCAWHAAPLAAADAEQDDLAAIAAVREHLRAKGVVPAVQIEAVGEVSWGDWAEGGGSRTYVQPRTHGSAILQRDKKSGAAVVFVLNHYPVAAEFRLRFAGDVRQLRDVDTGRAIDVRERTCVVDVDRKSAAIFVVS